MEQALEIPKRPLVGIGLLVTRSTSVLLGERRGSHGASQYGGPGGHLELGESFEESIMRELAEEIGQDFRIKNLGYLCTSNLREYDNHYVDIGMHAEWESGEPVVMEPNKLVSWNWYDLSKLPSPLFGCVQNYIDAYTINRTYFP